MKVDVLLSSDSDSSQTTFGFILVAAHTGLLEVVMVRGTVNIVSESF